MNSENRLIFERYAQSIVEATYGEGEMSVEQLKNYLAEIKGTVTGVTVEVEAPVRMNKKNRITGEPNPFGGVIKKSIITGTAGGDYELGVMNRELDAHADNPEHQPQFKAAPLWNGKGIRETSLLVRHADTGEYYLVIGDVSDGAGSYELNGQPITREQLAPYVAAPSEGSVKQAAVGIAREDQKNVRYPKLSNIRMIDIKGYKITVR